MNLASIGLAVGLVLVSIVLVIALVALRRSKRRQRQEAQLGPPVLQAMSDLAATMSPTGTLLSLNRAGRRLLGVGDEDELRGLNLLESFPPWAHDLLVSEGIPVALETGSWSGDTAILGTTGKEIPMAQTIIAHRAEVGRRQLLSTVATNSWERRHLESQLVHVATHDSLTDLFNRRRFEEELRQHLAEARRYGREGALIFLDVDGLKKINDTLGHLAGDQLLIAVADVLRSELRESEILARWGGDEFAAILLHADQAAAITVANRILTAIREKLVVVHGETIRTTASIGLALIPEHGETLEDLLVSADLALYEAKTSHDMVCAYSPTLNAQAKIQNQRIWEQRIREALDNDRLVVYAQPIYGLDGHLYRYELLLRLMTEDGQLISPGIFLPIAERSGLINVVDRWVVKRAIELIHQQEAFGRELRLSVNLSGRAFLDEGLQPLLESELKRTGINPESLVLEITESAAIADLHNAAQFMTSLKSLGLRFAIDDFGVGFSSFFYLKRLPVDYLKIDGSFIQDLPRDKTDQHLVRSMVELARGLGMKTVAEFVGDLDTMRLLKEYGVDYAQGYFVGEPRSIWDILPGLAFARPGTARPIDRPATGDSLVPSSPPLPIL